MAGAPLRAAIIGVGFVGPHHVDAVRRGGYGDVVALAGSNEGRVAARAAELGIGLATTDVAGLLADPAIDVVHVCTPNDTHVRLATAALEAGKHVVVEKPIALDAATAATLAEMADRVGRHALTAFTYRGYPMLRRARRLVAAGEIGDVRLVHGAYLQDWLAEEADYNWRIEPQTGGASRAVADIGSHWFDSAEFVSGRRVESVLADLATFIPIRRRPAAPTPTFASASDSADPFEVRSEDAATILVRFSDGARGSCIVSQVSPGHKNAFALELAGSRASLVWEQESPERLWLGARSGAQVFGRDPADGVPGNSPGVPALPAGHVEGWGGALRDLFRPFYAAIAAGEPPPSAGSPAPYPTLRDGARAARFVEAVLESARTERWTALLD